MTDSNLILLARNLATKISIPRPASANEINGQFVSKLYEKICQPFLEDPPIVPALTIQPKEHLAAILDSLSCNFVNVDLEPVLQVDDILAGDERALLLLLRIFDNLHDCLVPDQNVSTVAQPSVAQKKPSKPRARPIGPMYMGKRIGDKRSASVVYSPRINALRRLQRARSAQNLTKHPTETSSVYGEASTHGKIEHVDQVPPLVHRHRAAIEKRRTRLAIEVAKATIRNSSAHKRHVAALTKRAIGDMVLKSASSQLKLEDAKEKAREVLLEELPNSGDPGGKSAQRTRLLAELGVTDVMNDSTLGSEVIAERTLRNTQVRSLLSNLSSDLLF